MSYPIFSRDNIQFNSSATGFETLLRLSITLESTQVARIDAALKVGAISSLRYCD